MRISLDTALSPASARVLMSDAEARFDLAGLPRVDGQLRGMPVGDVPALVERLCGICPVAHHLAGVTALEALLGVGKLTAAASATRRLLHYGSTVDQLVLRLAQVDLASVRPLRQVAKAAMTAAGSPGHFPTTAVPGGVRTAADPQALAALAEQVEAAVGAAEHLVDLTSTAAAVLPETYEGANVVLADSTGNLDLYAGSLRAVDTAGRVLLEGATPEQWHEVVRETAPGSVTPRPALLLPGENTEGLPYRVGPAAHLHAAVLATPRARARQESWLASAATQGENLAAARAILLLHALETVGELARQPELFTGPLTVLVPEVPSGHAQGTGWVESPRGLLVHSYTAEDGVLTGAQILTPTVQTEPWLASMLTAILASHPDQPTTQVSGGAAASSGVGSETQPGTMVSAGAQASSGVGNQSQSATGELRAAMEAAIQAADPCLPCVSAPLGTMSIELARAGAASE